MKDNKGSVLASSVMLFGGIVLILTILGIALFEQITTGVFHEIKNDLYMINRNVLTAILGIFLLTPISTPDAVSYVSENVPAIDDHFTVLGLHGLAEWLIAERALRNISHITVLFKEACGVSCFKLTQCSSQTDIQLL